MLDVGLFEIKHAMKTLEKYLPVLAASPLFAGTSNDEILAMLGCLDARRKRIVKNAYILRAGDTTHDIGLLLEGRLLVLQEDVWGHRNIMGQVQPGGLFAETFAASPDAPLAASVVAQEDGAILLLDLRRVLKVCTSACLHHTRIVNNLITSMAERLRAFSDKITHMSRRTTREKLLSYLSAEAQRQRTMRFEIPFNRQQLADFLCVERAAMSVELSRLQKEGVLKTDKNAFTLFVREPGIT